jgi:predicted permease
MDRRKVRRLAEVLIASQLRAGGSNSRPRSFLGRPLALLIIDVVAFVALFSLSLVAGHAVQAVRPGLLSGAVGTFLPFLPLIAVASALVGGLTFELASTSKFATSDAVNWLPLRSLDYTVASALALTVLYSLSVVVLGAVALGVGAVTGTLPVAVLAVVLGFLGLLEGALLIELLRGVTQRAGSLGRKRGSATLVLRAAVFLLVILGFELFFNPVILLDSVRAFGALGPVALVIPFLWGSDAVQAGLSGDLPGVFAATIAELGFLLGTAYLAARARSKFWVPTGGEVEFERHVFGQRHPVLRAFGLSPSAAALVGKDLRGLVRRRELLPGLLLPFVIGVILLVQTRTADAGGSGFVGLFQLGLLVWVGGLSALLLSSSSFGQERRGVVHLLVLPIRPPEVYRAKAAATLLVALPVGFVLATVGVVLDRPPIVTVLAIAALVVVVVVEATAIGLAFAARFSDFQDRPRPQFVRSLPMLGAMFVYLVVGGLTAALGLVLASGVLSTSSTLLALGLGAGILAVVVGAVVWAGSTGVGRLLRELPV